MRVHGIRIYIWASIIFLLCVVAAVVIIIFVPKGQGLAMTVVSAGAVVCIVLILGTRPGKGSVKFNENGATIEWDVRSDYAIRTVFPEIPTDSTKNVQAISLANEGRALVKVKSSNPEVDLSAALEKFQQAAALDKEYWEPRINIAQILLLSGQLKDAFSEAESVRLVFRDVPLAYAKAGLIIARVMEQGISGDDPDEMRNARYAQIAALLKENLERCAGHLTTMTSLGRALILAGEETEVIREFLSDALQYPEFVSAFKHTLEKEELLQQFNEQFPGLLNGKQAV